MGATTHDPQVNYTINITLRLLFNSLSFIGSVFIIVSFLKFRKLRKFAFKLICYLSVSDLIFSIAGFLIIDDADTVNYSFCAFQGFALYYSSISTVFWTACIAYSLHSIVLSSNRDIEKNERKLLFVGFVLPVFLAMVPLITKSYGPSSFLNDEKMRWCGIRRTQYANGDVKPEGIILDWVVRFVPVLSCFLFNTIMYFRVRKFFLSLEYRTDLKEVIKNKIKYFPIIPIFCWSIEIFLRILEIVYMNRSEEIFSHDYIVWVEYFDSILEKSHGFINALVYGCTQYVKNEWKGLIIEKRNSNEESKNPIATSLNNTSNEKNSIGSNDL